MFRYFDFDRIPYFEPRWSHRRSLAGTPSFLIPGTSTFGRSVLHGIDAACNGQRLLWKCKHRSLPNSIKFQLFSRWQSSGFCFKSLICSSLRGDASKNIVILNIYINYALNSFGQNCDCVFTNWKRFAFWNCDRTFLQYVITVFTIW